MYELDGKGNVRYHEDGQPIAKTSHTLNPVWFIIYRPSTAVPLKFNPEITSPSLTNIAATCFQLLGLKPPEIYDPPLLLTD